MTEAPSPWWRPTVTDPDHEAHRRPPGLHFVVTPFRYHAPIDEGDEGMSLAHATEEVDRVLLEAIRTSNGGEPAIRILERVSEQQKLGYPALQRRLYQMLSDGQIRMASGFHPMLTEQVSRTDRRYAPDDHEPSLDTSGKAHTTDLDALADRLDDVAWDLTADDLATAARIVRTVAAAPGPLLVADEPDDGLFLLFYIDGSGCTVKCGYVYPDAVDAVRAALADAVGEP